MDMDWTALISALEATGLTQKEIAEGAGCSQPYISQLKAGHRKGPEFSIGQALVEMRNAHLKVTGEPHREGAS